MTTENIPAESSASDASDLEFAKAFEEFSDPVTKTPEEIIAEAAVAAKSVEKTPEEIAAEATAAAKPVEKTPEEIAAEATAAAAAAKPVEKTPEEIAAEAAVAAKPIEKTPEQVAAEESAAQIAALQADIEALKPKPAPAAEKPLYTAEETELLTNYRKEWPDISKAEALARREEYRELVSYVFQQVRDQYGPALEYITNRSGTDQYTDIVRLVPDYDAVRDKAVAWIDTQPAWIQPTYRRVVEEGTPSEVAGFLTQYKKETGYVAPVAVLPVVPAAPVVAATPALPAAAQKAAAKLKVVPTGRSDQQQGASDEDFAGAFEEFAAAEEKQAKR